MTKQEQEQIEAIHKMAQIALGKQITLSCTEYAIKEGFFDNFIALYNAGYRKLPEDSIVLTKEEIEQLKKRNEELTSIAEYQQNLNRKRWKIIQEKEKENNELKKQVDKAKEQFLLTCENCRLKKDIELLQYQKEQAVKEEFAEKLKERCHNYYPSIDHYCCSVKAINVKDINELLKEYEE